MRYQSSFRRVKKSLNRAACSVDLLESRLHLDASRGAWSAIVGHDLADAATAVATDSSGNIYVAGKTQSIGSGWFDDTLPNGKRSPDDGTEDGFIVKYGPDDGRNPEWGRYIGFSGNESISAMAVGDDGTIYVTGTLDGRIAAFGQPGADLLSQRNRNGSYGGTEAFVCAVSADHQMLWATIVGGSGSDAGNGIALTSDGKVIVVGETNSPDAAYFRTGKTKDDPATPWDDRWQFVPEDTSGATPVPFGQQYGGGHSDAYASALDAKTGQGLWFDYLPGIGDEYATSVTSVGGIVYIAGASDSSALNTSNPEPWDDTRDGHLHAGARQYAGSGKDAFALGLITANASWAGFTYVNANAGGHDAVATDITSDRYGNPILIGTAKTAGLMPHAETLSDASAAENVFVTRFSGGLAFNDWGVVISDSEQTHDLTAPSLATEALDNSLVVGLNTKATSLNITRVAHSDTYDVDLGDSPSASKKISGAILKLDYVGRPYWSQAISSPDYNDSVTAVAIASDHSIVVAGTHGDETDTGTLTGLPDTNTVFNNGLAGGQDGYVAKYRQSVTPKATLANLPNITLDNASSMQRYSFSITYSDESGIDLNSVLSSTASVYRNGVPLGDATVVATSTDVNAETIVVNYALSQRTWTTLQNGVCTVKLIGGQTRNVDGFFVAPIGSTASIGTFTVDMGRPTASFITPDITTSAATYRFTVVYDGHTSPITRYPKQLTLLSDSGTPFTASIATTSVKDNVVTVVYTVNTPSTGWPSGNLNLAIPAGSISDGAVTNLAASTVFKVNVPLPTATFPKALDIIASASAYTFTVQYDGQTAPVTSYPATLTLIDGKSKTYLATIRKVNGHDDVLVDGNRVNVTYIVNTPLAGWPNPSTLTIQVDAGSVTDGRLVNVAASHTVNIAIPLPEASFDAPAITDPAADYTFQVIYDGHSLPITSYPKTVTLTGPGNISYKATFDHADTDANRTLATYRVTPPKTGWPASLTINIPAGPVSDGYLTNNAVTCPVSIQITPPAVSFTAPTITHSKDAYGFTVIYDGNAHQITQYPGQLTLSDGTQTATATVESVATTEDPTGVGQFQTIVNYIASAPSKGWTNGHSFTITVPAGSVSDGFTTNATARCVAAVAIDLPTVTISAPNITASTLSYEFSVTYTGADLPITQYPHSLTMTGKPGQPPYTATIKQVAGHDAVTTVGKQTTVTYIILTPAVGWPNGSTLTLSIPANVAGDGYVYNAAASATINVNIPPVKATINAATITAPLNPFIFTVVYDGNTLPIKTYPNTLTLSAAAGKNYTANIKGTPVVSGNKTTVTYKVVAPSGGWQNGTTLTLTIAAGTASDGFVSNAKATRTVSVALLAPTATITAPAITAPASSYSFNVTFGGTTVAIKSYPKTVSLTTPEGDSYTASLVSTSTSGTSLTATYRLATPSDGWPNPSSLTISIPKGSVSDGFMSNASDASAQIIVAIPFVSAAITASNINAATGDYRFSVLYDGRGAAVSSYPTTLSLTGIAGTSGSLIANRESSTTDGNTKNVAYVVRKPAGGWAHLAQYAITVPANSATNGAVSNAAASAQIATDVKAPSVILPASLNLTDNSRTFKIAYLGTGSSVVQFPVELTLTGGTGNATAKKVSSVAQGNQIVVTYRVDDSVRGNYTLTVAAGTVLDGFGNANGAASMSATLALVPPIIQTANAPKATTVSTTANTLLSKDGRLLA